jgi:dTDP-4-amino-4,6-dideoxygalactose transaminase
MPVHYSGGVGQLDKIYCLAENYNLRVIEDAAHAFGTIYKDRKIGSFGDISCFSFDGIKNITSGEGGCVVTDDIKVLDLIKDARLLGVEKDTDKRFKGDRSWSFDVKKQGWRYHMSDIMAAIGIEQLKRFGEISSKRMELAYHYDKKLKFVSGIRTLKHDYTKVVPHIYPVLISQAYSREKIIDYLKNNGIATGVHYLPNNSLTYFSKRSLVRKEDLKVTDRIANKLLTLPLHEDLSKEQVEFVVSKLKEGLNNLC